MNPIKAKAISPIITTILLVVVAVIIVTLVLNWGKFFTTDALSKTDVVKLTQSDAESFVYPNSLKDGVLQFNYSPPSSSNFEDITISSYRVLSDSGESPDTNLSSSYTLRQSTNIISLPSFSSLGLEANQKVTIILQTTDNQYISINNITNNYSGTLADLPYVMFGSRRLYIQQDQNATTMTWATAISYCNDLNTSGYDDWYLPSYMQLAAIWNTYTYQEGDDCLENIGYGELTNNVACINNTIRSTYAGEDYDDFVTDDYYWSSTEFGPSYAFSIVMGDGSIFLSHKSGRYYVRCVRDQ